MSRHAGVDLTRVMGSQEFVNRVAAVPSLHARTALLIALFFCSGTTWWRWLGYLGEHYVSDVLSGRL